jgi:hypothetical protein
MTPPGSRPMCNLLLNTTTYQCNPFHNYRYRNRAARTSLVARRVNLWAKAVETTVRIYGRCSQRTTPGQHTPGDPQGQSGHVTSYQPEAVAWWLMMSALTLPSGAPVEAQRACSNARARLLPHTRLLPGRARTSLSTCPSFHRLAQ